MNHLLKIAILVIGITSCKKADTLPTTPTEISGIIADDKGRPIHNVEFELWGTKKAGPINSAPAFSSRSTSDSSGRYELSVIVPNETEIINFAITEKYNFDNYVEINGAYQPFKTISQSTDLKNIYFAIGKKNILNFKRTKQ